MLHPGYVDLHKVKFVRGTLQVVDGISLRVLVSRHLSVTGYNLFYALGRAVDPDPHGSAFIFPPDPDLGSKIIQIKTEKMQGNW